MHSTILAPHPAPLGEIAYPLPEWDDDQRDAHAALRQLTAALEHLEALRTRHVLLGNRLTRQVEATLHAAETTLAPLFDDEEEEARCPRCGRTRWHEDAFCTDCLNDAASVNGLVAQKAWQQWSDDTEGY